jgi:hypothetical protein
MQLLGRGGCKARLLKDLSEASFSLELFDRSGISYIFYIPGRSREKVVSGNNKV